MIEFLRQHQLNIMLFLSGICTVLAILCFFTRSMEKKRRHAIMFMEIFAALLLIMDRFAYIYRGNTSELGWWMVRITNFCVFLFSLTILHFFNLYVINLFTNEGGLTKVPRRLRIAEASFGLGVIYLIFSCFTNFYYYFDEMNYYHRGNGFLISYLFPCIIIILDFSIIVQYYKRIARGIRIPLFLFAIIPMLATFVQIFAYGLSLQNISLVGMAVLLYIFVLLDMNNTVMRANKIEVEFLKEEQKNMRIMFEQTATALANAIDAKDVYTHGHSMRVAEYAQRIAIEAHKDEKFCGDIYYAGLLHDVGKIGIPDTIINKRGKLSKEEFAEIQKHPVIGRQILSSISKSPYLSIAANSHHERYDGRGYPEGLKGEDIPEVARIIAVADSYDAMTSKRSYRDTIPQQKVREEIVKGMGTQFDPQFAKIMLHIIDLDTEYNLKEFEEVSELQGKNELRCEDYRSSKSEGILLGPVITKIKLHAASHKDYKGQAFIPSFIVFDSLDGRIHETEEKRRDLLYSEYAVIRFDGKTERVEARKLKTEVIVKPVTQNDTDENIPEEINQGLDYEIEAVKSKDHVLLKIENKFMELKFIIALPDSSHYCYLGLTGEHCTISKVEVHKGKEHVPENYIPRIAPIVNYIRGPQGDIPNIQIDAWRTAATEGVLVRDDMKISFHTMSLPTARLIWHCPFITLFYSDDKKVNGPNFKEFVLIRIDGENWESDEAATNTMHINKNDNFEGWDAWKNLNKKGMDCTVFIKREGRRLTVTTENAGISIKSITVLKEDYPEVYVSLTGDQCVITNIRIS